MKVVLPSNATASLDAYFFAIRVIKELWFNVVSLAPRRKEPRAARRTLLTH
jgi:hypothetical protein